MDIFSTVTLFKYILIGIGVIGIIVILFGLIKSEAELAKRGVYLLIISIVLSITAYFMVKKTEQRVEQRMMEYYENEYE